MTYEEAREFIDSSNQYGSKLGLEVITELLKRLDNPQDHLKVIHVAGTNGKGSTAAFLSTILAEEGYLVGRYISPAVFTYRERVQISRHTRKDNTATGPICIADEIREDLGRIVNMAVSKNQEYMDRNLESDSTSDSIITDYITERGVAAAVERIQPICEAMARDGYSHPTSFEIETAMAFLYMVCEQVDFAVIEVGMGGRLDATNVIRKPVCSVITSVSMDHMQFLGDTLEQIAGEKAGIIKKASPAVTGNRNSQVCRVLERVCDELDSKLITITEEAKEIRYSPYETSFTYQNQRYTIGLLGEYQIDNAILAIQTAKVLRALGYGIKDSSIVYGLNKTRWKGRFELLAKNPYFIIDGAHNEAAAYELEKSIKRYFPNRKLIFILGVLADKDYHKILKITAPYAKIILTVRPQNSRSLDSHLLAKEAEKYTDGEVIDTVTVSKALKTAYEKADQEDVILAFGSLSYLGELCKHLTELR